ncbi:MAG: imidazole glycerol phosphate synthase subunit HisH, partial [Proteobacteria bacterium]
MITIIDYGMGNLGSISNMFKRIGVEAEITGDKEKIAAATKMLLPGVGAFDAAMQRINDYGFRELLDRKALQDNTPVLG